MNTVSVSMAVTPTVLSTLLSHYFNRKPLRQRPTAHLSYDEGLHLIRSFLEFASNHTVEDLQAFTSQWVPHPHWVKVDVIEIPEQQLAAAASALEEQLGPVGIRKVGGRKWWQWRRPRSPLKAEWIEMRADYQVRKKSGDAGKRVVLYVHGGAYFFGSVDEHRYQLQRHARKLKARVLAPRYRLAPQFPFPCGLQDCLAAYLHLLTTQEPNTVVLAGDSAGGGMVLSMLVTLRDRGLPLPAGAILISPWVDLMHSFPSVAEQTLFDYIPQHGFHHKPSASWPPPNSDQVEELKKAAKKEVAEKAASIEGATPDVVDFAEGTEPFSLKVAIDGEEVVVHEQIQMYTTNELLSHPLVSPVMQPTLGGLCPLLIMVGGGEILRDEQIYLAHKCANPAKYALPDEAMDDKARAALKRFKPTDVQLQVWDDLCHVAPTLSFTRPAKYMYRSIAQFGAWALARAQKTEIDILDDDDISIISASGSDSDEAPEPADAATTPQAVGKAGDPLPPFRSHMIRQRVSRHGILSPLDPIADLPGCNLSPSLIGFAKPGPVGKWLKARSHWTTRYSSASAKVHKVRLRDMAVGYETSGPGEYPPPSALAGRRKVGADMEEKKKRTRSYGLALWSLWGSKHDEMTVHREEKADRVPEVKTATEEEGAGARGFEDIERQEGAVAHKAETRSRSRRRLVRDESQIEVDEDTPAAELAALMEKELRQVDGAVSPELRDKPASSGLLSPSYVPPDTGVTGKRPYVDGIAVPFSLKKEAETASMVTLNSARPLSRPMSPVPVASEVGEAKEDNATEDLPTPVRPQAETFVTAAEDLPLAATKKE